MESHRRTAAPGPLIGVALLGALAALVGGYWDDAWHTERGRDEFFIAPHIAIYAGVAAAGAALALWALTVARGQGLRRAWEHRPLALAALGVTVTLASGPIDNAWHVAFGRDAVIWSPPHMLGIAGLLALGAAMLAELATRPEAWVRPVAHLAGALVLAAAAFATVEYDTDVPQFDEVFYLPVLGTAAAVALALIRTALPGAWAAVLAASLYTLLIVGVAGLLAALGFAGPSLPLLVAPALIVDVARHRAWSPLVTAAAFTVVLHLAYVPARNWLGGGVRLDGADVAVGTLLTLVGTFVVFMLAAGRRAVPAATVVAVLAVVLVPGAMAHDPGQGDSAGTFDLTASSIGRQVSLTATAPTPCDDLLPVAVVARRAGEVVRAPATREGCTITGSVEVTAEGRWFVYLEGRRRGRPIETWLPLTVADGAPARVEEPARYAYVPPSADGSAVKVVAGVALYAGVLALLLAAMQLVRAAAQPREVS